MTEQISKITKNIVVIYHGECPDGFSAAWVAWKKFGDSADYVATTHGDKPPVELKDKDIFMFDFVYPEDVMTGVVAKNKKVIVIDHHKSAEKEVKMAHEYVYKLENSGAVLVWQYFYPNLPVPWLLRYIEDRDIWIMALPYTLEMGLVIDTFDKNFETWSQLSDDLEDNSIREKYIQQGKLIRKYEDQIVGDIVFNKDLVCFNGLETYAVNAPGFLASQIGDVLRKEKPPIAIIWRYSGGQLKISLRSDGSIDVAEIAQKYGGGGHKTAAAFKLDKRLELPWENINS